MNLNFKDFGLGGFFGFLLTALVVAVLAYSNGGSFSFGFLSANFSSDSEILASENKQLTQLNNKLEIKISELESQNNALKQQLTSSELLPITQFETSVNDFVEKYGQVKTSMVDVSCENDITRQFRLMRRELSVLKSKALELDLLTSYKTFFDSFSGTIMRRGC